MNESIVPENVEDGAEIALENVEDISDIAPELQSIKAVGPKKRVLPPNLMRGILAIAFVIIFLGVLIGAFYSLYKFGGKWEDAKDLIEILLPAVTALLGSVVGFYFGSKEE